MIPSERITAILYERYGVKCGIDGVREYCTGSPAAVVLLALLDYLDEREASESKSGYVNPLMPMGGGE